MKVSKTWPVTRRLGGEPLGFWDLKALSTVDSKKLECGGVL